MIIKDHMTANLIGCLCAALVPAVMDAAWPAFREPGLGFRLGLAAILYLPSLFFTVLLGGPVFVGLRRLNLVRWWTLLPTGFLTGSLVAAFVGYNDITLASLTVCSIEGAGSALLFWLVRRLATKTYTNGPAL